jgi:hypothetical protein
LDARRQCLGKCGRQPADAEYGGKDEDSFHGFRTFAPDYIRWHAGRKTCSFFATTETRVGCRRSFIKHREYIAANPVKAGLERPEEFPYCFPYLARRKAAGAKALK